MQYQPGQRAQGHGSHPQEQNIARHEEFGIAPGAQHALGEDGIHGLENHDEGDGIHQAPGDDARFFGDLIIIDDGRAQRG